MNYTRKHMRREDQLQKEVVKLLKLSGLTFTATANGAFLQGDGRQRAIRGARMKDHGVSNGVPDLLIFDGFSYIEMLADLPAWARGVAIELKAPDEKGKRPKPTASQLEWHERLRRCGWRVEVCYSTDEVLALLRECYPGKFP